MKKFIVIFTALVLILLIAFVLTQARDSASYHFSEFEHIKTNINTYQPSLTDRLKGIRSSQDKWDYHLQKLVEIGALKHKTFVFSKVPYTEEAGKRIWLSANSIFPNATTFTSPYYSTNASGYGVNPYVLEVWDTPGEMERWAAFVEEQNH